MILFWNKSSSLVRYFCVPLVSFFGGRRRGKREREGEGFLCGRLLLLLLLRGDLPSFLLLLLPSPWLFSSLLFCRPLRRRRRREKERERERKVRREQKKKTQQLNFWIVGRPPLLPPPLLSGASVTSSPNLPPSRPSRPGVTSAGKTKARRPVEPV